MAVHRLLPTTNCDLARLNTAGGLARIAGKLCLSFVCNGICADYLLAYVEQVGSDLQKTRDAASTGLRGPHQVLGKEGLAVSADGLDMEDAAKGIEAVAEELDNEARELKLVEAYVSDLVHYRDWTRCSAKKTMRDVLNRARHIVSKKHRIFPPLR